MDSADDLDVEKRLSRINARLEDVAALLQSSMAMTK